MASRFRLQRPKVRHVRLGRRQPAVSVNDLALMLEIDLELGRHDDFRRRLQRALEAAREQGKINQKIRPPRSRIRDESITAIASRART